MVKKALRLGWKLSKADSTIEAIVLYIDDIPDNYLSLYLADLSYRGLRILDEDGSPIEATLEYNQLTYSNTEKALYLLDNEEVRKADLIIIDYKLFEDQSANENNLTGSIFRLIFRLVYPYKQVFVLSQHDDLSGKDVFKKCKPSSNGSGSFQEANDYYDSHLKPAIEKALINIKIWRNDTEELGDTPDIDRVLFERIQSSLGGSALYVDLSDRKIDELIKKFSSVRNELLNHDRC